MTLIDLLKVTDPDTRIAIELPYAEFAITGTVEELVEGPEDYVLAIEVLESVIKNVYLSKIYNAIYITVE